MCVYVYIRYGSLKNVQDGIKWEDTIFGGEGVKQNKNG